VYLTDMCHAQFYINYAEFESKNKTKKKRDKSEAVGFVSFH